MEINMTEVKSEDENGEIEHNGSMQIIKEIKNKTK